MQKKELQKSIATDLSVTKIKAINALHNKIVGALKKTALCAFEIGEQLYEIRDRKGGGNVNWQQFIKENFDFSPSTANTYMRIYDGFKDKPALLNEFAITQALDFLGDVNGPVNPGKKERQKIEYGNPLKQLEFDWESVFQKPPVSKANLKNYRFECPDLKSLWLIKRGFNIPVKVVDIIYEPTKSGELKYQYEHMMKGIQTAIEMYFEQVEKTEKEEE